MVGSINEDEQLLFEKWFSKVNKEKFKLNGDISIQNIKRHFYRDFELVSLIQERRFMASSTFYDKRKSLAAVPEKKVSNDDLWIHQLANPLDFVEEPYFYVLPGTEYRDDCDECKTEKIVECYTCLGKGKLNCKKCITKGRLSCTSCNSTGTNLCGKCNGAGISDGRKCFYCNGAGRNICGKCVEGFVLCGDCEGQGLKVCIACGGTKEVDCRSCDGIGEVQRHTELKVNHFFTRDKYADWSKDLPDETINMLKPFFDSDSACTQQTHQLNAISESTVSDSLFTGYSEEATALVNCHLNKLGKLQSDERTAVDAWAVRREVKMLLTATYMHNGDEYSVSIVDDGKTSYYHERNPWEAHIKDVELALTELINKGDIEFAFQEVSREIKQGARSKTLLDTRKMLLNMLLKKDLKTKLLPALGIICLLTAKAENENFISFLGLLLFGVCIWVYFRHQNRKQA